MYGLRGLTAFLQQENALSVFDEMTDWDFNFTDIWLRACEYFFYNRITKETSGSESYKEIL